eukprot:2948423-Prymnesium_polylepis.2
MSALRERARARASTLEKPTLSTSLCACLQPDVCAWMLARVDSVGGYRSPRRRVKAVPLARCHQHAIMM